MSGEDLSFVVVLILWAEKVMTGILGGLIGSID